MRMIILIMVTTILITITIILDHHLVDVKDDNWSACRLSAKGRTAHKMSAQVPRQSFRTFDPLMIMKIVFLIIIIFIIFVIVVIITKVFVHVLIILITIIVIIATLFVEVP